MTLLRFEHHKFLKAEIYCHHLQILLKNNLFEQLPLFFLRYGSQGDLRIEQQKPCKNHIL